MSDTKSNMESHPMLDRSETRIDEINEEGEEDASKESPPINTKSTTNGRTKQQQEGGTGGGSGNNSTNRGFSLVYENNDEDNDGPKEHHSAAMGGCESVMQGLSYLTALLTFPFSLTVCLKVVAQYERAVIFRLGRLISKEPKGPGLVFILPCLDSIKLVDLRTFTFNVPTQEVLTKDSVTVAVDAVVYYRIFNPIMSVVNVEDANRSTRLLAQTTLRNVLGTVDLYQLLAEREQIASNMQECLDTATETWGVKVERVDIKDVRLPIQLQRAMAAEAEAAREAKAKVIAADGERSASKALKEAASQISDCPIALQLRYLQTLRSISDEKNSTIIFPIPIDFQNLFQDSASFQTIEKIVPVPPPSNAAKNYPSAPPL